MTSLILLGYIAKSFGIKGGLVVKLLNDDSESLLTGKPILLRHNKFTDREMTITAVMDRGRIFLSDIHNKTMADAIKGAELWIARADLPALSDDEYYLSDLLTARVVDKNEKMIGEIVGFSSNGAQILFEIKTEAGHVASIPSVVPIVEKIDIANKKVVINAPIGLLDDMTT